MRLGRYTLTRPFLVKYTGDLWWCETHDIVKTLRRNESVHRRDVKVLFLNTWFQVLTSDFTGTDSIKILMYGDVSHGLCCWSMQSIERQWKSGEMIVVSYITKKQ